MITYRILPSEKLIIIMHHVKSSFEGVINFRKKLYSDSAYSPEYDVINDSRRLNQEYTFDEVANIAKYKTPHPRIAMIASSDLSFEISRTWEMLVEGKETKVSMFRDVEKS
jgi:hypothetical protein